tara:strand:- start:351 stop:725 length:375 start_codon:yes stop_codon:yes gene_type:complete
MKQDNQISSILSPEVEITGDVKVSGSILIYGKILGKLESKGTVRTAKGSYIKGNIFAKDAQVSGKVDGDLAVNDKVTLGNSAYLTGNLNAKVLVIEEGAQFDGVVNMVKNPDSIKAASDNSKSN